MFNTLNVFNYTLGSSNVLIFSTFALIKPVPPSEHGKIITFIMKKGFRIVRMRNGKISKDFALELYRNLAGSNMMP